MIKKIEKECKNLNKLKLRKFESTDFGYIMENWVGNKRLGSMFFKNANEDTIKEFIKESKQETSPDGKADFTYCIDLLGKPVGMIRLGENWQGLNLDIFVDLHYRKHNIATKAFELIQEIARQKGFKSITSSCSQDNTASEKLHRKLGFTLIKSELSPKGVPMYRWEKKIK